MELLHDAGVGELRTLHVEVNAADAGCVGVAPAEGGVVCGARDTAVARARACLESVGNSGRVSRAGA